jgi:hypothetical protein
MLNVTDCSGQRTTFVYEIDRLADDSSTGTQDDL